MKIEKIKTIPKYIVKLIKQADKLNNIAQYGQNRYYSYLSKNDGELCKITCCVRNKNGKWYIKQCAIHGINSEKCFVKDMGFTFLAGYQTGWFAEGLTKYQKWYEDTDWGWAEDKYFNPFAPIVNRGYLAKIKEFKYSAFDLYDGDLFNYLKHYREYPEGEYLVKMGLAELATKKQILELCRKSKQFRKWLGKNANTIKKGYYYTDVIIRSFKKNEDLDKLQQLEKMEKSFIHDNGYKEIKELFCGKLERFFLYILENDINIYTYKDYIRACKELGLDLTEDKNLLPHDFNKWHDIRIDEYHTLQANRDKEKRKELYDKFLSISTKYASLEKSNKGMYVASIPSSPQDLINEGEALHHCVGRMNYDQKFAREESLIFFIRNKDAIDTPLVTIEYSLSQKKVLQCYAINNSQPTEEIQNFVYKSWLPYANKQLKKLAA